jgi:hypothetical protein
MRQRLNRMRPQSMARRPGEDGRFNLSPRARQIGGWLAVLVLVLGIAAAVRLFGGNADGDAPLTSPSATAGGALHPITFGTALDAERLVPADAVTNRFAGGDTFAYAVPDAEPATAVYVEVRRISPSEVLQAPTDAQQIPGAPARIGFTVPAADLLEVFGPGSFTMLIYLDPASDPIAEGTFELVEPLASPSGSP